MNPAEYGKLLRGVFSKNRELATWLLKYGAVLLVFLVFFVPIQSRLSNNSSERSSLKKQIDGLEKITSTLLTPEEIERVKGRIDTFESKLADLTKTNAILDEVSRVAEENHLKMIQIYSDGAISVKNDAGQELAVDGKKLSLLPVIFRVEADYKSLANFLKILNDNAQWTYTVESMQLQTPVNEGESLQCDLTISYIIR